MTRRDTAFFERLTRDTQGLRAEGLYKSERVLGSPQQAVVQLADGREVVNLCANNYLGLANHPALREVEGVLYCNDGDWVESRTLAIEDLSGALRILRWPEEQAALLAPPRVAVALENAA